MYKADYIKKTLHFKEPADTSRGTLHTKDSWFIRLWDTEDPEHTGIGECSVLPGLTPDAPDQLDQEIERVCTQVNQYQNLDCIDVTRFPALYFALEMARRDLTVPDKNVLFPSAFTKGEASIPINGLIWMGDFTYMAQQVARKLELGYRCIKMKIGAIAFDDELYMLKQLRKKFGPSVLEIRLDANGAFEPDKARRKLNQLWQYDIHSIEQPIQPSQINTMQALCASSPIAIALDEELIGVYGSAKKKLLHDIQPQIIILKPSLLGGFTQCEEWIRLANDMNINWWITSALESNIGLNAIAQWTYTLNKAGYHGLGTGQLFTNNIESPLYLKGENLFFDPNKSSFT